jgi:putative transposase
MIVGMRTVTQAAKVAQLTGGALLSGKPKPDGTPGLSRYVDVGADFELHRATVESVSVLFDLFDGDAANYGASGSPGEKLSTGWLLTAAKFEVEWPAEEQRRALVWSHFGARRFVFNWGLAQVKADLDAKPLIRLMKRWTGIWVRCARCGTGLKTTLPRGGRTTPKSAIRRVWPTWRRH